jgi:acyl-CoA thioesterase-1
VVFIGTSLTAGLGLDPDSAYPALVERKADSAGTPISTVNAGVSGETSAGALRRIDWVLGEPADVVVVETGANDGLRGQSTEALQRNLEQIVGRARALHPNARVAWCRWRRRPTSAPRTRGASTTSTRRWRGARGATLFPFLLDRRGGRGAPQPARRHPPERGGARRVAATVWRALAPLVAMPERPPLRRPRHRRWRRGGPARLDGDAGNGQIVWL